MSKKVCFPAVLSLVIMANISSQAHALTAKEVLDNMRGKEAVAYVSGIVDGLAYARWLKDKPSDTGMKCIFNWYYHQGGNKWRKIDTWLRRHPDKPVDLLMHVFIKRKCGS